MNERNRERIIKEDTMQNWYLFYLRFLEYPLHSAKCMSEFQKGVSFFHHV